VPEVVPEKTSVSFIPTDGSAELKLLVDGEPEQVDEVGAAASLARCILRLTKRNRLERLKFSNSKTWKFWYDSEPATRRLPTGHATTATSICEPFLSKNLKTGSC
jgi:hypothetical protein